MAKPLLPFWGVTGTKTEPPAGKKNAGFKSGRPESAQYFNWFGDLVWKWLRGLQGGYAEIVVGSAGEVTSLDATNTADDFVAALANGGTVRFLAGTQALSRNEDITETDVTPLFESDAILDDGTDRTFTVSGARARIGPGRFTGFTAGDIIISGAGSQLTGIDLDATVVVVSNGAEFYTTGASGGLSIGGSRHSAPIPFGNVNVFHDLVSTFTTDFVTDDKLDATAHGFANGLALQMTTSDTLPAGLSLATTYYVINQTANDYEVSLTPGGSAVDITDDGMGTHTATPHFVVPDGVTRIYAELYGAGGGGGAGFDISSSAAGGAGGAGAGGLAEGYIDVTPGDAIAFVIGVGGVGSTTENTNGTSGAASTFSGFTGNGGEFGTGSGSNAGDGGTASGGDINIPGGGGGAGAASVTTTLRIEGGIGGSNKRGTNGRAGTGTDNGGAGSLFGGGGGGGGANSNGTTLFGDGGDGGDGGLIIWH